MVVRGDQISMVALPEGKKVKEFRFKIDPAKMPKAIDLCVPTDQDKGKTGHGIYELEGDRWKLCFPQDDNAAKERPTSFKSEAGSRSASGVRVRWVEPEGPHSVENIGQRRYHAIRVELK